MSEKSRTNVEITDSGLGSMLDSFGSLTFTDSKENEAMAAAEKGAVVVQGLATSFGSSKDTQACSVEDLDRGNICVPIELPQDKDGDSILHIAICYGNEDLALKIISCISWASMNAQNNLGQTPIFLAVCLKMTRVIRKLIDIGADLTSADMNGNTILHVAAESGINISLKEIFTMTNCRDFENFSLTLQSLLGVKNYEGFTAFHLAARNKKLDTISLLLQVGDEVNAMDLKAGFTALHHLVETGDVGLVQDFISMCNPDLDAVSYSGITPLHLALGESFEPIADILIISGADTRKETFDGLFWQDSVCSQYLTTVG